MTGAGGDVGEGSNDVSNDVRQIGSQRVVAVIVGASDELGWCWLARHPVQCGSEYSAGSAPA